MTTNVGMEGKWMMEQHMSAQDKSAMDILNRMLMTKSMLDNNKVFNTDVEMNVIWDGPPAFISGRDNVRVMLYMVKNMLAHFHFEPIAFQRVEVDQQHYNLHIEGIFHVHPNRPFWPMTWMMPEDIPVRASACLGVTTIPGSDHVRIYSLKGRPHNIPIIPQFMRATWGMIISTMLKMTEGMWTQIMPLFGDTSLRPKSELMGAMEAVGLAGTGPATMMTGEGKMEPEMMMTEEERKQKAGMMMGKKPEMVMERPIMPATTPAAMAAKGA